MLIVFAIILDLGLTSYLFAELEKMLVLNRPYIFYPYLRSLQSSSILSNVAAASILTDISSWRYSAGQVLLQWGINLPDSQ